jgi:hypothetical protein
MSGFGCVNQAFTFSAARGGANRYDHIAGCERHYPDMEAYELLSSASDLVGIRNLIYWVDHDKGVAFGFYYNTRKHRRLEYRVLIFQPKTDFQPNGCVTPPQKLRQLRPYSLDPPANAT